MFKSYIYKLKPTDLQVQKLEQTFGNCRYIYNRALGLKKQAYELDKTNLSAYDIMKLLTKHKKKEGFEWLSLTSINSLQSSISNMDTAYKNFFRTHKGFPKFKSKHTARKSFHIKAGTKIDYSWNGVLIPKIGWTKFFDDRHIDGEIVNATVIKKASGYYISIVAEKSVSNNYGGTGEVGIDLGLKHFLITSDGEKIDNPKFYIASQRLLRKKQRHLSRQKKGSKRSEETKRQIARLHEHIANQRKDFLHKVSTTIAKQYDVIYVEDLNIAGMVKNRCLSKAISDVGWGMFGIFLNYKANNVIAIGRFEPSSKMCCNCGYINQALKLHHRERTCVECNIKHDRDISAAINIKQMGRKLLNK